MICHLSATSTTKETTTDHENFVFDLDIFCTEDGCSRKEEETQKDGGYSSLYHFQEWASLYFHLNIIRQDILKLSSFQENRI